MASSGGRVPDVSEREQAATEGRAALSVDAQASCQPESDARALGGSSVVPRSETSGGGTDRERIENLERQLDRVDDALGWKGTGEGRVSMALAGAVAMHQLRDLWVRELYTEEGALIWVADAESKGHSIVKQLQRLDQLRTGAFA